MRLYLPTTLLDLGDADGLRPATAHAVTPKLAEALFGEGDEELELAALLAAADASVALLAEQGTAARRRVVVVAELGQELPVHLQGGLPSLVEAPALVPWSQVISLHVDDVDAEADVTAAAAGDEEALERAAERDLLWYDVSELEAVRAL